MTTDISIIISLVGVLISFVGAIFIAGFRQGGTAKDILYIRRDLDELRRLFIPVLIKDPNKPNQP